MQKRTLHYPKSLHLVISRVFFTFAIVVGWMLHSSSASAITINLSYDTSSGNFPAYDPDGSKLSMICSAAANVWKDLLPFSNNSYSVTIHWEQFDNSDPALAVFNGFDNTIRVRTNANWFIDSTPTDNGEFNPLTQQLYRDLTPSQQNWFNGSVPALLETGCTAAAVSGGVADGKFDMLSVLTHEMGHFTAIGWNALKPDVDLPQSMLGWQSGVSVIRENESHIMPDSALMDPFIEMSTRILPSALDVLVAAHEQGHSSVQLRRVDWFGNSLNPLSKYWFDSIGWEGGQTPNSDTAVTVRNKVDLQITAVSANARTLLLSEDSTITILDNTLSITLDASLAGSAAYDHPKIQVQGGGALDVGRNLVISLGSCELKGGTANIGGLLVLDKEISGSGWINTSTLRGFGSVQVGAELRNRSTIAGENGTLTISTDAGGTLDLDGNQEASSPGHIDAKIGNLMFIGPLHDDFNGNAYITGGHSIGFAEQFAFGTGSTLSFYAPGGLAEFFSASPTSHVAFDGANIEVDNGMTTQIRAHKISLTNLADVSVKNDSVLSLKGNIEYAGGLFTGSGTLQQNGDATILSDTVIGTAQYDWDGFNLPTYANTIVSPNVKFTLNSDGLGDSGAYNGRTELNNHAELSVNILTGFGVWMLGEEGSIRFVENARLEGSAVIVAGTLEAIEGSNHVDAAATLTTKSLVLIHDKASLSINSPVAYGGGIISTVSGDLDDSKLQQNSTASVLGHHRITVGFFNWDAANDTDSHTTIQSAGFLEIHAKEIGNGASIPILHRSGFSDTIDMNGGKLSVLVGYERRDADPFPFYWTLNKTGVLNLNLGEHALPTVLGSKLINNGLISGSGVFENVLENRAEMRVGHAEKIGSIQLLADFSQTSAGSMAFELAGLAPTTLFDQIYHDAPMTLDGTLDVAMLSGFTPSPGDLFRIIDGNPLAPLTGTFGSTNLPSGTWDVIYGSYFVDLRFSAVPEPNSLAMTALAIVCCLTFSWKKTRNAKYNYNIL